MGLSLPSELTEPLSWLGMTWPEADEDLLREAGQQWISFGEQLTAVAQQADTTVQPVWTGTIGDASTAFEEWWTRDAGPQHRLADDARAATLIGAALIGFAAITLTLKLAFIAQLGILAFQIGQAVVTAFFSFGATSLEIPGFIAASRLICRRAIDEAVGRLRSLVASIFERARGLLRKAEIRVARMGERWGPRTITDPLSDVAARTRTTATPARPTSPGSSPS